MTTDANTDLSGAARFGHVLGRGLRRILNVERAFWLLLSRAGVPGLIVTPVKWGARAAVVGTGAFFVAWGLLYVLAVVCFIAIAIGFVTNPDIERALRGSQLVHLDDSELPLGTESNAYGQTKSWFESDKEYKF
ncbi:hypothetical protein A264_09268 [Pseudomonas syringae pv. actinidiae ICMP 19071]|uniref:DUF3742 family protein n=3 Tax=Pseudomonas syringae group TaxID=136849 RepID=A0AB35RBY0_PSEA0|nr:MULTISPECIES: DUF3742 family protein [Pseudomonas syringae group]AVB13187.1 DUF3742 domain-containing protein [Pseudomonas amygdali pv. morsprunorum]EPM44535.1 hypothetical protein A262_27617 [Pseudomonas syringae pv. actinidiae ICMP 19073]EPM60800.1 hypothetical protein A264_09268 [Pseudomonas syringae pv. actinidiae ICMP 19071]EPM78478.1 hypothetical protein A3SO_09107 [Pseudomonas syringae pv. actinidiae ICMP 19072]KPW51801.1 hypothetical protein ALO86_200160 [Pseudomonas syringae pv. be